MNLNKEIRIQSWLLKQMMFSSLETLDSLKTNLQVPHSSINKHLLEANRHAGGPALAAKFVPEPAVIPGAGANACGEIAPLRGWRPNHVVTSCWV